MSPHRIWTVASLELRQRRRASRWPLLLGLWLLVVGLVTVLTWTSMNSQRIRQGAALYDITTFAVLGLALLVVPSLTATSVNGDREHGVLASLQTTLITPWELVLGKLLASWVIALVFLATTLPFLAWAWVAGGIGVGAILRSLLILVVVLAAVCAVGLAFSTLTARPVASAVLTYLTVAGLALGSAVVFFLALYATSVDDQVRVHGIPDSFYSSPAQTPPPDAGPDWQSPQPTAKDCVDYTRRETVVHPERVWWLLAMNPFVTVADAAPRSPLPQKPTNDDQPGASGGFTPMQSISDEARLARKGTQTGGVREECQWVTGTDPEQVAADSAHQAHGLPAIWPYGLGFFVVLGGLAAVVAQRRVRTPVRRLPNGTRIA